MTISAPCFAPDRTALAVTPAPQPAPIALEDLPFIARKRAFRLWLGRIAAAAGVALVVWPVWLFLSNPAMRWDIIAQYLFAPISLDGVKITLWLTAGSAVIGVAGGTVLALLRMHGAGPVRLAVGAYINLFRAVPLLVQILICYNLGAFFPRLGLFIPLTDIGLSWSTNAVLSPLVASFVAIGLHQSAYLAEIIRAGLETVPAGQTEAARALGMTAPKVFWRVTLPLGLRAIIPPFGNDMINLLKATSLVSVVGVGDLMTRAEGVYAVTYQVIPLLLVASLWYIALTAALSLIQGAVERRFARHLDTSAARPAGDSA